MEILRLLLDPRVWALLFIAAAVGFVGGCMDESARFESWRNVAKAAGEAQERISKEVNRRNQAIRSALYAQHQNDLVSLRGDLAAANERLRHNANSGFVPKPSGSSREPVRTGNQCSETERAYLTEIYRGGIVCYRAEELDQGIRKLVADVRGRNAGLALAAVDALDDRKWWGEWSIQTGACRVR